MNVIAAFSMKGGVGKTATAVNLAYLSAATGQRTLLWDLDPQGAASYYLRIKPHLKGGGKALINGRHGLGESIKGSDFERLDLVPADFSLRNLDLRLEESHHPTKQVQRLLKPLAEYYDQVLIDSPPGLSLISENIIRAADALLVPLIPTPLSTRTLEQLRDFLDGRTWTAKLRAMPFFSLVDRRKRLHLDLMEDLPQRFPGFLKTHIPYCSEVERMGIRRMPLPAFAPTHRAVEDYRQLWAEIQEALKTLSSAD